MMISAVGRKNRRAATTHRLMDEVPLCAAAAIHRGPSTAAMLNSSTSQKPMARRSSDLGVAVVVWLKWLLPLRREDTRSRAQGQKGRPAQGSATQKAGLGRPALNVPKSAGLRAIAAEDQPNAAAGQSQYAEQRQQRGSCR